MGESRKGWGRKEDEQRKVYSSTKTIKERIEMEKA